MREAYQKTKDDAEQTINARDEEVSTLTQKVGALTLALKQAQDDVEALTEQLEQYEEVVEEEEPEEEVEVEEESE